MTPTLRDALVQYRRENRLRADEAACASWTCRLGPVLLRLPNFAWRRRAIDAHDLHHVLTGYPCTMRGEFQMAAWEFGAGGMPHWAATCFCLPLVLIGLLWSPRHIYQAFCAGCRAHSLHGVDIDETLLSVPLDSARKELTRVRPSDGARPNDVRFAGLIFLVGLLSLLPPALLSAILVLYAL